MTVLGIRLGGDDDDVNLVQGRGRLREGWRQRLILADCTCVASQAHALWRPIYGLRGISIHKSVRERGDLLLALFGHVWRRLWNRRWDPRRQLVAGASRLTLGGIPAAPTSFGVPPCSDAAKPASCL